MIAAETMRAAVLVKPGTIELRDLPRPQPPPGGMVVRVRAALTDGTDLKAFRRGHPQMPMPTPFGHEFSGDVAEVDSAVSKFKPGDPVMCVHSAPCGECYWCTHAQEELCKFVMPTMILGAYAEFIQIPERIVQKNCYAKPADLSYVAAAFLEPLACVVHSIDLLNVREDDTVLIIGNGGFGLLHAMLLKARASTVLLVGGREVRLALARRLGIETIDRRTQDPAAIIRERTREHGADIVIECTGREDVWEAAPSYARRGGTVSLFGGLPSGTHVRFEASRLHYDEVRIVSPFHFTPDAVRRARELLLTKQIDPLPLITQRLPLSGISSAFDRLILGEGIKFAIEMPLDTSGPLDTSRSPSTGSG